CSRRFSSSFIAVIFTVRTEDEQELMPLSTLLVVSAAAFFANLCSDLQIPKPNLQLFAINLQNIDTCLESIGRGGVADDLQIPKPNLQLFAINLQNIDTCLESIGRGGGVE
ncbi:Uncharacterized protein FWK35_00031555, partial [Aphis craccivora]